MSIAILNILANMAVVVYGSALESVTGWREGRGQRLKAKNAKNKLANFKVLVEAQPGMFPEVESNLEELKALDYCEKWIPVRKWLKANKIEFADFAEEIKF